MNMWQFSNMRQCCKATTRVCALIAGIVAVSGVAAGQVSGDAVYGSTQGSAGGGAVAPVEVISPYKLIEDVTAEVLAKIDSHRAKIEAQGSDAEKERRLELFFEEIDATLASVIDFNWIARNVMGVYGKSASADQRAAFAKAFRTGLVETYGRGLLSYSDQEIVVLPGGEDYAGKRKVSVRQEIRGVDANYPLEYSMGLSKSGQWRIINVIINGVNLGVTFRNQFVQAAQKNGGDIDSVIANWDSKAG